MRVYFRNPSYVYMFLVTTKKRCAKQRDKEVRASGHSCRHLLVCFKLSFSVFPAFGMIKQVREIEKCGTGPRVRNHCYRYSTISGWLDGWLFNKRCSFQFKRRLAFERPTCSLSLKYCIHYNDANERRSVPAPDRFLRVAASNPY